MADTDKQAKVKAEFESKIEAKQKEIDGLDEHLATQCNQLMKYLLYRYEQLNCPELIFGLVNSYYLGIQSYQP
jgi:phage host-nuclease inhibitor protein Gam